MARVINNVWIADFETATVNTEYFKKYKDTKVLLAYAKSWDGSKDFMAANLDDMMLFYMTLRQSIMVFYHNLNFDGDFIIKWLVKKGYPLYNELERDKPGFSFLKNGRQIYEIKWRFYFGRDYYTVVFRCSYRILSAGVEDLGKSVGIKKYNSGEDVSTFYDVEPCDNLNDYPVNFLDYCKRDVEIVRLCLIEFDNAINHIKSEWNTLKNFNWKSKLTASAIALKLQKEYVRMNKQYHIVKGFKQSSKDNELATEFYFGGFTQFNYNIQRIKTKCPNGIAIDINSAHPFSMTKKLPYGEVYNIDEVNYLDLGMSADDVCEFYELDIESAELKGQGCFALLANWPKYNNISSGPIFKKYRYLTEAYGFKCFYMKEEYEELCKHYIFKGVKVVKHYWLRANKYLSGYINTMYHYKSKFKEEGKPGLSLTFKIILNGGYGIHAKRNDYDNLWVCANEEEYNSYKHGDIITIRNKQNSIHIGIGESHKIPGCYIHVCKPIDKPLANNKFIACAITAWSRIYLWDTMNKIGFENCAYTDTDSIYMLNAPANLDKVVRLDKYELGAWDVECKYTDIYVLGAKSYFIKQADKFVKAKYSGINSKWLKDNLDEAVYKSDKLEEANLTRMYTESGIVLIWKDYVPKERNI